MVTVKNSNETQARALVILAGGGESPDQLPCHCQQHTLYLKVHAVGPDIVLKEWQDQCWNLDIASTLNISFKKSSILPALAYQIIKMIALKSTD